MGSNFFDFEFDLERIPEGKIKRKRKIIGPMNFLEFYDELDI